MKILKVYGDNISENYLDEIVEVFDNGGIIIYPTDTLYALGCDALSNKAINNLCKLKGINPDKTYLSIICDSISTAAEYAKFDNNQFRLLKENTPGAFTFIFKAASVLPKAFKGRKTVGVRIPDNAIARSIVQHLGRPIISTTIKYDDEDYATNPELIAEAYENSVDVVVDGGIGDVIPSTILDCTGDVPEVIREGKGKIELGM